MKSIKTNVIAEPVLNWQYQHGLTTVQLAKRFNVGANTISKLNKTNPNDKSLVTVHEARKFGNGLDINPSHLDEWVKKLQARTNNSNYTPHSPKEIRSHYFINQRVFARALTAIMKKNHITNGKLSKLTNWNPNYTSRITSVSSKNSPKVVPISKIATVAKVLHLNNNQFNDIKGVKNKKPTKKAKPTKKPVKTNTSLSSALKAIMRERHLTLNQIVDKSGLNHDRLQEVINGTRNSMPILSIYRLAQGLHIQPHKLLKFKATPKARTSNKPVNPSPRKVSSSEAVQSKQRTQASQSSSKPQAPQSTKTQPINLFSNISNKAQPVSQNSNMTAESSKAINNYRQPTSTKPNLTSDMPKEISLDTIKTILKARGIKIIENQPHAEFRAHVEHVAKDLNKLNDADVTIIDMIIQRILNSHYND